MEGEQEQEAEKPELSPEEQIENIENEVEARQEEIIRLTELVEGTKAGLNEAREKLGLSPAEKDPPSVFSEKDKMEKLKTEQELLEKQKEELVNQQEKEELIREEKERILQEKIDELFKEFEELNPRDLESVFRAGKTFNGRNMESRSMGSLDPEAAQSLAKAFKEGVKLLPKILEALPELLKKFDEDLTKEATERVEQKLEEEKEKMEEDGQNKREASEGFKSEKKPETPKDEISPYKTEPEPSPIEDRDGEISGV